MSTEHRPDASPDLSGAELLRWYWLKAELVDLARCLGVRTTGDKALLTRRIAARLDGEDFNEPQRSPRPTGTQLAGPLSASTVIPAGQRCSQAVRSWFVEQVGATFRFDGALRDFFAASDGTQTLQDALDVHLATRGQGDLPIGPQFEFNRFTRAWHEAHPGGTHAEAVRAWRAHRALPVDRRGRDQ